MFNNVHGLNGIWHTQCLFSELACKWFSRVMFYFFYFPDQQVVVTSNFLVFLSFFPPCSLSGLFYKFSNQVVCTFLITCQICFTCNEFSNTLNTCSSLKVRNELRHTRKSTINLIYMSEILSFLNANKIKYHTYIF